MLLAEDNIINTKVLVKYLQQLELNIHTVTNGLEAVELFASKPLGYFSLILMDCHMPTVRFYSLFYCLLIIWLDGRFPSDRRDPKDGRWPNPRPNRFSYGERDAWHR